MHKESLKIGEGCVLWYQIRFNHKYRIRVLAVYLTTNHSLSTPQAVRLITLQTKQLHYEHNINIENLRIVIKYTGTYQIISHNHIDRPMQRWTRIKSSETLSKCVGRDRTQTAATVYDEALQREQALAHFVPMMR